MSGFYHPPMRRHGFGDNQDGGSSYCIALMKINMMETVLAFAIHQIIKCTPIYSILEQSYNYYASQGPIKENVAIIHKVAFLSPLAAKHSNSPNLQQMSSLMLATKIQSVQHL